MNLNLLKMFPFWGFNNNNVKKIETNTVCLKKEDSKPCNFPKGGYCKEEEKFRKIIESRNRK